MTEVLRRLGCLPGHGKIPKIRFGKILHPEQSSVPVDKIEEATKLPELYCPSPERTGQLSKNEKAMIRHPEDGADFLARIFFLREKAEVLKENYLKDNIDKHGWLFDREKGISLASKDKQHLGEDLIMADSAKCSPSINEVECQDREKGISLASKDKQHLEEDVIKADSAKSSPSINEVECQDREKGISLASKDKQHSGEDVIKADSAKSSPSINISLASKGKQHSGEDLIKADSAKSSPSINKVECQDREKGISLASKDEQHLEEDVIKADSAKSSPSINEVECQDETEILHPPDLSAAPIEDEVGQKLLQIDEAKNDHDVGSMELLPSVQVEHGSAKFPELSRSTLQLPPMEVERSVPLEPVDARSSSSRSNDTSRTACRIEGDIYSGAENEKMGPILSTSISVEGELCQFVDINLEIYHWTSSSLRADISNGFLCCNFLSEKENYRILTREKALESKLILIFRKKGDRPPSEDQWKQANIMVLADNACPSLPEKPDSPNLVLLFLQRNPCLRAISESFFITMPSLRVVDLSDSKIHSLPSSLFELHKLQVLILRNCSFVYSLPPAIERLEHVQVLDLLGTELESVPDELGKLTNLRQLQISFYGTDDERGCDDQPSDLLSSETISKLQRLEALSIVVHPEDVRWVRNAEAIMQDIGKLEHMSYLQFYFPKVEIMEQFTKSPSWNRIDTMKFKIVVGQDVKRIVDRVSSDVGNKFNEKDRSLRFVNGNEVPEAVKTVLNHATAFYLDHHSAVCSLSEFGITNCNQLAFCVVRECPEIKVVIISEKIDQEPVCSSIECLGLHYLWKLESICKNQLPQGSFFALKSLTVDTCPKLEYIFSKSLLQCLCNLEELIVEDCESLKEIIEKSDEMDHNDFSALPRLGKVKLYYLPQLVRLLWEGRRSEDPHPSRCSQLEYLTWYSCPKLDIDLLMPLVSKVIKEDYKHVI